MLYNFNNINIICIFLCIFRCNIYSKSTLWIDANHLTELPINSNIINGKTYINDSNKKFYNIKKNVYYFNNIIINSNHQKNDDENENSKNEYKNINQNQYSSSNSSSINYRFVA